jgi:hypothetical protein
MQNNDKGKQSSKTEEGFYALDNTLLTNLNAQIPNNDYLTYYTDLVNTYVGNENLNNIKTSTLVDINEKNAQKLQGVNYKLSNTADDGDYYPYDKPIRTIKSKFNSQFLSTTGDDTNKYNVIVNDKCMTVAGLCEGDYCLEKCQSGNFTSNSQKFTMERIKNSADAAKVMNVDPVDIIDSNAYPFSIFRSSVNNKCLGINKEGVFVEPCNLNDIKHQWQISPNTNVCRLE